MPVWSWIIIGIVAALVLAAALWTAMRTWRTQRLREGFGPEYDRAVADAPSKGAAESELIERRERREQLEIRSLEPEARADHLESWRATQGNFVDDPEGAITVADRLIQQVMRERGYPVEDFDQRAADLSVDHPEVVNNYRAGHAIAVAHERGKASTEDLRQAMKHYRALFEELVESGVRESAETR